MLNISDIQASIKEASEQSQLNQAFQEQAKALNEGKMPGASPEVSEIGNLCPEQQKLTESLVPNEGDISLTSGDWTNQVEQIKQEPISDGPPAQIMRDPPPNISQDPPSFVSPEPREFVSGERGTVEISNKNVADKATTTESIVDSTERLSPEEVKGKGQDYNKEVTDKSAGGKVNETDVSDWKKVSKEEYDQRQTDFQKNKDQYIKEWEEKNGQKWPRYEEDVYSSDGKLLRRKGDRYDAHHVQPLEFGGQNSGDNITPMHCKDHHDKQGIHRPGGPYDDLAKHFRNSQEILL